MFFGGISEMVIFESILNDCLKGGDLVHVYGNFEEHHDDKWSQTHASILGV